MMRLDVAHQTSSGNRYGTLNQDYAFSAKVIPFVADAENEEGPPCYIAVILDGHGMLGDKSAERAGIALKGFLLESQLQHKLLKDMAKEEIEDLLIEGFAAAHEAALSVYEDPPGEILFPVGCETSTVYTLSNKGEEVLYQSDKGASKLLLCGTTCTAVLVQDEVLAIANVGDSLVALGSIGEDGFEGKDIAVCHNGLNEDEASRVLTGHRLHSVQLNQLDGYLRVTQGIWSGHSLAVTRALGHKHLEKFGVSHVPTVSILKLSEEHCCAVLGSDGLWDGLEMGEAVRLTMDILTMGGTAGEAAHELVEGAEAIGYASGSGDDVDNTTATVMVWRVPKIPDN